MNLQRTKAIVIILNMFLFCIFIFSLLIITTDPQGVFIFIFTLPILFILSLLSFYFSKKLIPKTRFFLNLSKSSVSFIILFFILNFIPVLNTIPDFLVSTIAETFKLVTGKTPRHYFRDRNDLQKLILDELTKDNSLLDFSKISTARSWSKICVFIPYTSDSVADQLAGLNFKLSQYSEIANSDSINVIALFDGNSLVNYANLKRSIIDFDFKDSICIEKSKAQFFKHNTAFNLIQ